MQRHEMAKAMVRRAIAEKVPFGWVPPDAACRYSKVWRRECEQADVCQSWPQARHRRLPR